MNTPYLLARPAVLVAGLCISLVGIGLVSGSSAASQSLNTSNTTPVAAQGAASTPAAQRNSQTPAASLGPSSTGSTIQTTAPSSSTQIPPPRHFERGEGGGFDD